MIKKLDERGMGLLSILFAVAIIGFIYFYATNTNIKSGAAKDSYLKQTGVDASSYKSTIDSTKKVLDDAAKTRSAQE